MPFPHAHVLRLAARLYGRLVLGLLVLAALCLTLGVSARPALAYSKFTVTNCRSDAQLQADVAQANQDNASDVITFACSGDLKLTSTLTISGSMTISGSGQLVTLDGGNSLQVLIVNSGASLTLKALIIAHGSAINGNGGGLYNAGAVTITNSLFADNSAALGAGLFNESNATATITNSAFVNNSANSTVGQQSGFGGGLFNNGGTLTISTSLFAHNSALGFFGIGGGLVNTDGTVTISNSTFADNSASDATGAGYGGGLNNNGGTMSISTSTFTGNSAPVGGGIVNCCGDGSLTISTSTIANNSAFQGGGGGLFNGFATMTISNSTIANNSGSGLYIGYMVNISGSIVAENTGIDCDNEGSIIADQGYNLSSDSSCGFTNTGSLQNSNPMLSPLASNGGPTQTMALLKGSPAIDVISLSSGRCPATDQRGHKRPDGSTETACDMGAFES